MRAELPKREPAMVEWWKQHDTYRKRLERNHANGRPWILHDGPPYANGELHMGHFLNRFLKDAFVKIHLLDGEWADFIPGWDMHGLPIELETLRHLELDFHHVDPIELREKCRDRALFWLDKQRATMLRMGLFGQLRPALSHDRPVVRRDDRRHARRLGRTRPDLQGPALDAVVRVRRDGAGRSGDRVQATARRRRSTCTFRRRRRRRKTCSALRRERHRNANGSRS